MFSVFSTFLSIVGTLFASTTTAVCIFYINGYPFFNPNEKDKKYDSMFYTLKQLPLFLTESTVIGYYVLNYYIVEEKHTLFLSAYKCLSFSLGIEIIYYIYHRLAHMPFFYRWIHEKHHEKREVYPIDTFSFDPFDFIGLILSLSLPVCFIKMNFYEYVFVLYIYSTMGYVSHSTLFYNHHSLHHYHRKCNFCFLYPFMDIICGTYR